MSGGVYGTRHEGEDFESDGQSHWGDSSSEYDSESLEEENGGEEEQRVVPSPARSESAEP